MNIPRPRFFPLWTLSILLVVGCGGPKEGEFPVHPASGVVTYQGQPISGARVIFYPEDTTKPPARAVTDDSGRFSLTTYNDGDGAVAGSYTVTIRKTEGDDAATGDDDAIDPEVGRKMEVKYLIPERYGSPIDSGLSEKVTEDGPNEYKFDLD